METLVNKNNYDSFVQEGFSSGAFLQSKVWQSFLEAQNKKYWQIVVLKETEVLALCVLYQKELTLGKSYLYAPKGPIFKHDLSEEDKEDAARMILSKARDISIETKGKEEIFLKLEPNQDLSFVDGLSATENVQPQDTLFLSLNKPTEKLLADMHQKTRYNIMLANKKGVLVEISEKEEDIEVFLRLNKNTAARQNITSHPENYYRLLWKTLLEKRAAKLYLAKVGEQVVAANLLVFFGQTATYLHGASDYQYRSFMAPYLLQWQAIKDAMSNGFVYYDFWGIAPEDGSKPKWDGFTRFKNGFAGQKYSSPKAQVLVYQNGFYRLYKFIQKLRKFLN